MDKKMHKVTKKIQTAEGQIRSGKNKVALRELSRAAKANEKLVKEDRDVRDPEIKEYKAMKKKGC